MNVIYEDIKYYINRIDIPRDELYYTNKDKENIVKKFYKLENDNNIVNEILKKSDFEHLSSTENYEILKKILTNIYSDNTLKHLLDQIKTFGVWGDAIDVYYEEIIFNMVLDIINCIDKNIDDSEMNSHFSESNSPFFESNSPFSETGSPLYLYDLRTSPFMNNTPLSLKIVKDTYAKINLDYQLSEITYLLNDFYSELTSLFTNYKLIFFDKVILNKYTLRQDKYNYSGSVSINTML